MVSNRSFEGRDEYEGDDYDAADDAYAEHDTYDDDDDDADDDDEPTVPCPYCRRQIYEESQRCPYCERYISDEDAAGARKPWWILIGVALCLYAVFSWFF